MKILWVFSSYHEFQMPWIPSDQTLITGIGKINSTLSLSRKLLDTSYKKIVNLGICGAVEKDIPSLSIYAIEKTIEGDRDSFLGKNHIFLPSFPDCPFPKATLVTQDRAVMTEQQRQLVKQFGGLLVDMECFALAKTAKSFKVPFYSFKIVSDYADEETLHSVKKNILPASQKLCEAIKALTF